MSIINQMLRDLDARHASANERAGLPANLRPLPAEPAARPKTWLLLGAGLLAGALLAWLMLGRPIPQDAPAPAPRVAQAPVVPAEPPPAPPPPVSPAPPAVPPAPVAAPPPAPAPVAAPAKPRPAPAPAPVPAPPPVATPPAVAPAPAAAAPPGPVAQIDKQPKGSAASAQAEAEFRRGMQAAGMGDAATALPALRRAIEIDPGHVQARQALLSVLASGRQWDEVKRVARAGLALDPARSGWAVIIARLQHEQGDSTGALGTLESHAAHAGADADYQGLFAFLLMNGQRHAEAIQRYRQALALRPGEGRWWYGLGLALEAAGRGDEAQAAFGRARDTGNLSADMLGLVEQKLSGNSPGRPKSFLPLEGRTERSEGFRGGLR
jgi:MSHA biogenesis protein MshN